MNSSCRVYEQRTLAARVHNTTWKRGLVGADMFGNRLLTNTPRFLHNNPKHPILKYPQSVSLLNPTVNFTPIQNNGQIIALCILILQFLPDACIDLKVLRSEYEHCISTAYRVIM